MKTKVLLSEEEVKEIIKRHLKSKFENVSDVEIEVGMEWVGFGDGEHKVPVLRVASCEVEM